MDLSKSVIASTPSTVISQSITSKDGTPSQEHSGQLKKRYLDFNSCSEKAISVAGSKPQHGGGILSTNKLVPPLSSSRDTSESISQDCMIVARPTTGSIPCSKPTDNNKITIDKTELARLLEMTISQTKAEQRKEQREKREAEMSVKREAKRKKEEEKLRLQSEKNRNQKLQSKNFLKFFTKPSNNKATGCTPKRQDTGWIPTFPVQPGMTLAKPPSSLQDKSEFDNILKLQDGQYVSSYVAQCKRKQKTENDRKAISCSSQKSDNDVIIIEDKVKSRQIAKHKLFQFHENYRPAYYGTWQKSSTIIRPRNPFKKDEALLDYTVDSDDEWEEEEPGESLSDCHSGDEGEDMDDEDEEDGFFVPHGYLSDGEGELDDNETAGLPKESKEEKIKMKEKAWEITFARKCQPLKPVCIGCCWASNGTETNRSALLKYQAILFTNLPIQIRFDQQEKAVACDKTTPRLEKPISSLTTAKSSSPQSNKKPVPEEAMPYLIKLLQGSSVGLERAIRNLRVYWGRKVLADKGNGEIQSGQQYSESDYEQASGIAKRQLERKIHEIAKKVDRVWQVDKSVVEKYSTSLVLKNRVDLYTSPQNNHSGYSSFIKPHVLKENFTPDKDKGGAIEKQDECHSPAIKRLKLTETQSPALVIT